MERHDASSCRLFRRPFDPARIEPLPRACAGQEPDRVRRRLDEERARRHQRRLHRKVRRQDRRELCREFGAGQADRTGRAGRCFRVRRYRLDGLCDGKKTINEPTPRQPARQQPGADRAEGFQARQRHDRTKASILQSSPATAGSPPATCKSVPVGKYAKAALEKLGAWARGGAEIRHGGERSRRAGAGGARRGARSASSIQPTPRSSPA